MSVSGLRRNRSVTLATLALLAACSPPAVRPSASTIDVVGLIAEARFPAAGVEIRLESGQTWQGQAGTFRQVMNWGMKLLVVGTDANGVWMATLGPQGGLPADCYFTPERGTEWGDGIDIAGVLWQKAPTFSFAETPSVGSDYPIGTRFCMNEKGEVASIIPN